MLDNGLVFLCLAENSIWQKASFLFLERVNERFHEMHAHTSTVVPLSLNSTFKPVLRQEMESFNAHLGKEQDRQHMVDSVRSRLRDVKEIVVENIEKVLERGEKIELLVEKTDRMQETAFKFESSARTLQNAMWWENARRYLLMAAIGFLVVYFFTAMFCGGLTLQSC